MSPLDPEQRASIHETLDRILAGLRRLSRERTLGLLKPGIPEEEIQHALREFGLAAPPDLVTTYEWRNGSDADAADMLDELYIFPGYYFLSLEDAIADYRARLDLEHWDASWLPLLSDGGGSFFTVVCDAGRADFGQVVRVDEVNYAVAFPTVRAMTATIAQAYDDEIIYVEGDGYLDWDDEQFAKLASQMNPTASYWRG
jgi:cell wall assembly regulator SMI1